MFRLPKADDTYPTKVTVRQPSGDAHRVVKCTVIFRLLGASEAADLAVQGDHVFLKRAIAGWEDVSDENGDAIPCDDENIARVAQVPYFAAAAVGAYFNRFHPRKNY